MHHRFRDLASTARIFAGVLSGRRVFGGPRSAALSLGDACNTHCMMCWFHSPLVNNRSERIEARPGTEGPRRPTFMAADIFESIIRQCRATGTRRIVLCGNGEPALHPDFDRMLELIRDLGMTTYVITNGLALDEVRARLWSTVPGHFRFSMQAGDAETWTRVHAGGRAEEFEQISRAIRRLAASGTPHVSTLHVVHRSNFRNVRDMVEHAHDLGVREIIFRPVRADNALKEVVLTGEEEAELRPRLQEALRLAASYGIRTNLAEYLRNNLYVRSGSLDTSGVYRTVPCYVGWLYAEFDIDGAVLPCIGSERVMGHVTETPVDGIWNGPEYRAFRREARAMPNRGGPVTGCTCNACPMYKYNVNMHELLRLRFSRYSDA